MCSHCAVSVLLGYKRCFSLCVCVAMQSAHSGLYHRYFSQVISMHFQVQEGVDLLLYNLLVLGCITDVHGHVWRRSSSDLYLIEAMPLLEHTESQVMYPPCPLSPTLLATCTVLACRSVRFAIRTLHFVTLFCLLQEQKLLHQIFSILPSVKCCSPSESLTVLEDKRRNTGRRP